MDLTLLAPIALSAACSRALAATWFGFGPPCCAIAGPDSIAAGNPSNSTSLFLMSHPPYELAPGSALSSALIRKDEVRGSADRWVIHGKPGTPTAYRIGGRA